eukprot:gnl/TRDRNA2_/TRDRNA2_174230_c4_seq57.p1 gnl/TRDRNA2_/TRDRNA2_174230_c4~~gnl/TRDRNA2_/TRDRNA2_174230_c4_seq57.p1  ORF type:complete len:472 (-),score=71.01 gnl/TRDRNA2_/TRDRNA2_174230_c4_seq57:79-1494(-)
MVGEIQERDGKLARYLSEFLGTFLLVFTVGCNVLAGDATWAVTSIACVYMVSIYALGDVSGAHFNPAVSLSLGISRKLQFPEMGIYIIIQLVAGLVAALCYSFFFSKVFFLTPGKDYTWLEASIAELIYTAMLCFVVLNVCASKTHAGSNQFYGLAVGFVIVAGGYAAGHISGGCFNPAITTGIFVSGWTGSSFVHWLVYVVAECLGAALAAGLFFVVRPDDFGRPLLENGTYPLYCKLVAEFLGTFMIVLTVGLNILGRSAAPEWSIAAALMCMVYALGSVSGSHFNPAVTLAVACAGRKTIEPVEAVAYVGVQIVGGLLAAFTYAGLETNNSWSNKNTFPLKPGQDFTWKGALCGELAFTFVLAFVFLNVATTRDWLTQYFGFAIGASVTAGGVAIGAVSGGSLNPAISLGIATSHLMNGGEFLICTGYVVAELLAGALAATVFCLMRSSEFPKEPISVGRVRAETESG